KLYFLSYTNESLLHLTIQSPNYPNLIHTIPPPQNHIPPYHLYTFSTNSKPHFLLPHNQNHLQPKIFFIQTINTTKFNHPFFTHPSLLREHSNLN
ncbi:two-component system activity regulator YycH, partial [Bacillus altitudinis]|uniref:two-component system activity regulator YycH n=1 Tax=Bacillus altitudinis TaxID=293387 RepID=UPI003B518983